VGVEKIDIALDGIGHAAGDGNFAVPKYQRSYAWEKNNILDLFHDVQHAIQNREKEYFLGSIVVATTEGDRPEVVDGQQRLATVTILLAAIRDFFALRGDGERAETITSTYLMTRDLRSREIVSKLRLNDRDHDFFMKRILAADPKERKRAAPSRASHRKIECAAKLAAEYVEAVAKPERDPTEVLLNLVEYFEKYVKVIVVSVPSFANAFTIFETLNDRGLDLAISDLLKNFLFGKAGARLGEVQQAWVSMYSLFEAAGNEDLVVDFIRQLWSSHYGLTREKELYEKIKPKVTSNASAVDVVKQLECGARLYQAIVNTGHEMWAEYGTTARDLMATLNTLGITRIRPLVIAVLDEFDASEVTKALKLMVSWAVRFMIVGGLGTGTLEEYYSSRAKEIRDGKIKSAAGLRKAMQKLVPSDREFQESFGHASVSKSVLARYYLRVLEREANGEQEPELLPNENKEEVNLEHVLPETPGAAWKHLTTEMAEAYTHRIGNLALMRRRDNKDVGNESSQDKAKAYAISRLRLTKQVAEMIDKAKSWGPTEIENRQKEMSALAVKAWPIKC
jgi:hypothetical protein